MMTNVEQGNEKDSKKIFTMLILVVTLAFCTTSATYAYFAIGATNNNTLTGTAATGSLIMTNSTTSSSAHSPDYVAPTKAANRSLPMVPQISHNGTTNVLQKAFDGATGKDKCVDDNGNVICKAYTFVVKNLGTSVVAVRGSIQFSYGSGNFNHLRWKLMDSATEVTVSSSTVSTTFSDTAPIVAGTSKIYFDKNKVSLSANGGAKQYWLIVWIEESGADQSHIEPPTGSTSPSESTEDYGTWTATIAFEAVNNAGTAISGITSTITG